METTAVLRVALCVAVLVQTCSCGSSRLRESRQTSSETTLRKGCVLPEPPEGGKYTATACGTSNKLPECQSVPGTTVPHSWPLNFTCNEGYNGDVHNGYVYCLDGTWTPNIPVCTSTICGRFKTETSLLRKKRKTPAEQVPPWFVGIYRRNKDNQLEHICGGTLISPHIVLTAAHCLSDPEGKVLSADKIKVALGKRFRDWNREEPRAAKAEVREIRIPRGYHGHNTKYAEDMALIDLKASVLINNNVMPACVDWGSEIEPTSGQIGTLTGWGRKDDGTFSNSIAHLHLSYEDNSDCILLVPAVYRAYVTDDKFCSISPNDTVVTVGYTGGGLTFQRDGIHYVQGVLSTKVGDVTPQIVTYSNVQDVRLSTWLLDTKRSFDEAHNETYLHV